MSAAAEVVLPQISSSLSVQPSFTFNVLVSTNSGSCSPVALSPTKPLLSSDPLDVISAGSSAGAPTAHAPFPTLLVTIPSVPKGPPSELPFVSLLNANLNPLSSEGSLIFISSSQHISVLETEPIGAKSSQPSVRTAAALSKPISVTLDKSVVIPPFIPSSSLMTDIASRQQIFVSGSGSMSAPQTLSPFSLLRPPIISSSTACVGTPGSELVGLSSSISSLVFSQPPQRRPLPLSSTPSNTPMPDTSLAILSDTPFAGNSRPGSVQTSQDWSMQSNSGQMPRSHQPSVSGPPLSSSNGIPEVNSPGARLKKVSLTFAQRKENDKEKVAKQLLVPGHSSMNVCETPKDHC